MVIEHNEDASTGRFFIRDKGKDIGEISYTFGNDEMQVQHTEVDPAYRDQKLGGKLVEAAVEYARKKQWKLVPICSYANAFIRKNQNLQDVLKK